MNIQNAYWIKPNGHIIDVGTTHIRMILDNPHLFNLDKQDIINLYKKYNEKIGLEGEAREEIMRNLMRLGWIRVRYMRNKDTWTFQTQNLNKKEKDNIYAFIEDTMKYKIMNKYADVTILIIQGSRIIQTSALEALTKIFERKKNKFKNLINDHNIIYKKLKKGNIKNE